MQPTNRVNEWELEEDFIGLKYENFHLIMKRHEKHGHLNGYVGVPKNHIFYGKDEDERDIRQLKPQEITFAGYEEGIPGLEENYWYFGFDCAHVGDFIPNFNAQDFDFTAGLLQKQGPIKKETSEFITYIFNQMKEMNNPKNYKNMAFVSKEVQGLFAQLNKPEYLLPDSVEKRKQSLNITS